MQRIDKVAVLEAVAAAWNQAGITYAVAHGIDGYPAAVGRDLDVLVQADQVTTGLAVAEHVLDVHGFTVFRPPPLWGARLLAIHNAAWDSALEIHTITQLSWRNVVFADTPRPCEHQGRFQVDPWASFSKRILLPLLSGGTQRYTERPHEWALYGGERDAVPPILSSLCGAELAQRLYQTLVVGDPSLAAPLVPHLRRACTRRAWVKSPVTSLQLLGNAVRKKLVRPWAPCAPVVALVGPDDVGKSTTLRSVATGDSSVFTDIVVRHWRPGVLPRLGDWADVPAPVPGPDGLLAPHRAAGRFYWLRLCYYLLDYVVGHIKDRIESSHQRLVLYNRHALDMLVDPPRFGFHETRATWPLKRLTPKPDLVVLLYDTPERIHARKPELAPSDIQRQLQHWLQLADEGKVDAVILADVPPEQVSEQIKVLIMGALIAKNGGPAADRVWGERPRGVVAEDRPETSAKAARRAVRTQAFRRDPWNALLGWFALWRAEIDLRLRPPAPWVAVLGPDGSGKSSVLAALGPRLIPPFSRVEIYHWRPGFLRASKSVGGPVTNPHGRPPRGLLTSLLKLGFLFLDWTVGHWGHLTHLRAREVLILFDRNYHDLLVDPKRYRYGGPLWLARFVGRFIPQPDLVILLDAPPEVIQTRKQEVPLEEATRQRQAYLKLVGSLSQGYVVDASEPLNSVVAEIERVILDHQSARTARRLRLREGK